MSRSTDRKQKIFLESRARWIVSFGITGSGVVPENSLYLQCHHMVKNHYIVKGLNKAGHDLFSRRKQSNFFSSNNALWDFIWPSYIAFQCMSIRRLTDPANKDDPHSLLVLIDKIEKLSPCIVREVFVRLDKYPYPVAPADADGSAEGTRESLLVRTARKRDGLFDVLAGKFSGAGRKSTDIISPRYWKELRERLQIAEIDDVRKYSDKFLAHADKGTKKLPENVKKHTMEKFEACHSAIIGTLAEIGQNFLDISISPFPRVRDEDIVSKMQLPFADAESIKTTKKCLKQVREMYKTFSDFENGK